MKSQAIEMALSRRAFIPNWMCGTITPFAMVPVGLLAFTFVFGKWYAQRSWLGLLLTACVCGGAGFIYPWVQWGMIRPPIRILLALAGRAAIVGLSVFWLAVATYFVFDARDFSDLPMFAGALLALGFYCGGLQFVGMQYVQWRQVLQYGLANALVVLPLSAELVVSGSLIWLAIPCTIAHIYLTGWVAWGIYVNMLDLYEYDKEKAKRLT